jgi:uncharacterized membrane protein HdeD (DUF308 family)
MRTKKPWLVVAKLVFGWGILTLIAAALLIYAGVHTGSLLYWFVGAMLAFGGGVTIRAAWDLRK